MKSIDVKGTARTATGKKACRDIRKAGAVPCNLYGEAKENGKPVAMSFTATQEELSACHHTWSRLQRLAQHQRSFGSKNLSTDNKQ